MYSYDEWACRKIPVVLNKPWVARLSITLRPDWILCTINLDFTFSRLQNIVPEVTAYLKKYVIFLFLYLDKSLKILLDGGMTNACNLNDIVDYS